MLRTHTILLSVLLLACEGDPGPGVADASWWVAEDAPPPSRVVGCAGPYGCPGQQTCVGDVCDECTGCTDLAGPAWTTRALARGVVDLHSRGDGTAVALLSWSPWLVGLEGSDEAVLTHITVDTPLEDGRNVFVASDGTIYVHRRPRETFVFHKFAATGEMIWTFEESVSPTSTFAGFAENSAGTVLGGWYRDSSMQAVEFSADGLEVIASAAYTSFGIHFSGTNVREFTILSDNEFLFASNSARYSRPFLGRFIDGAGLGVYVTTRRDGSISNVILDNRQLYVGHGSNSNNVYHIALERYSVRLEPGWSETFPVFVEAYEWLTYYDRIYQRAAVAKVANGLVLGTTLRNLTDGGRIGYLQHFGTDGTLRGSVGGMGPVRQLVPVGPNSLFVVWSNDLRPEDATFVSLVQLPPPG